MEVSQTEAVLAAVLDVNIMGREEVGAMKGWIAMVAVVYRCCLVL